MTTVEKHTDDEVGSEQAEEFAREHPGLVKFGRDRLGRQGRRVRPDRIPRAADRVRPTSGRHVDGGNTGRGGEPDRRDRQDRGTHGGVPLLLVIVGGLVIYSCWRIVSALLPADSDVELGHPHRVSGERRDLSRARRARGLDRATSRRAPEQRGREQRRLQGRVLHPRPPRSLVRPNGRVPPRRRADRHRRGIPVEGDLGELPLPAGPSWRRAHLVRDAGRDGSDRVGRPRRE